MANQPIARTTPFKTSFHYAWVIAGVTFVILLITAASFLVVRHTFTERPVASTVAAT